MNKQSPTLWWICGLQGIWFAHDDNTGCIYTALQEDTIQIGIFQKLGVEDIVHKTAQLLVISGEHAYTRKSELVVWRLFVPHWQNVSFQIDFDFAKLSKRFSASLRSTLASTSMQATASLSDGRGAVRNLALPLILTHDHDG